MTDVCVIIGEQGLRVTIDRELRSAENKREIQKFRPGREGRTDVVLLSERDLTITQEC